jgi:RNA polymerase sigma-70 factor (ECF subfamily)
MTQELTAEALVARIARHEETALGELYDRCAPRLLGMALRILPDRSAAEQVIEDVFVRLWQEARHHPPQDASVAVGLVIAARNAAIRRRRAEHKMPPLSSAGQDSLRKSLAWLPRPEQIALLDERRELLNKVLNQLPKPQRHALELAVFEGYTEAEIAAKLGEPLGRVQAALRAGMRFLRHRLRAVLGTWAANI